MNKPIEVIIPKNQADLERLKKLDKNGKLASGMQPHQALEDKKANQKEEEKK
jgi:hypothetical protein